MKEEDDFLESSHYQDKQKLKQRAREQFGPLGPNLSNAFKNDPGSLPTRIMAVYNELGGDAWLLERAMVNPDMFLTKLLSKIIPTNQETKVDQQITFTGSKQDLEQELKERGIPIPKFKVYEHLEEDDESDW